MKKLFLFLFLCSWAATGWAQRLSPGTTATAAPAAGGGGGTPTPPPPRWKQHMDSVFQNINPALSELHSES